LVIKYLRQLQRTIVSHSWQFSQKISAELIQSCYTTLFLKIKKVIPLQTVEICSLEF